MNKANRIAHVSDRAPTQQSMDAFNAMGELAKKRPGTWLTDEEVNALYIKELKIRHQNAKVFWPGLGDRFLPDQIVPLKWTLQSNPDVVFVPINRGGHWYFIALHKNAQGVWQVHRVDTPGDGLCGKHTVTQSMQVLDMGFEAYAKRNPSVAHELDPSDPIQPQIQAVLNSVNNSSGSQVGQAAPLAQFSSGVEHLSQSGIQEDVKTTQCSRSEFQAVTAESLKINKNNRLSLFDYKLAQLAEYELLGYSVEYLCQELIHMLIKMEPNKRSAALDRLEHSSKLHEKPSIAKIIKGVKEDVQSFTLSASRMTLMPAKTPALKPGSQQQKGKDEELNYGFGA